MTLQHGASSIRQLGSSNLRFSTQSNAARRASALGVRAWIGLEWIRLGSYHNG
jgi:hypothetical protein